MTEKELREEIWKRMKPVDRFGVADALAGREDGERIKEDFIEMTVSLVNNLTQSYADAEVRRVLERLKDKIRVQRMRQVDIDRRLVLDWFREWVDAELARLKRRGKGEK